MSSYSDQLQMGPKDRGNAVLGKVQSCADAISGPPQESLSDRAA